MPKPKKPEKANVTPIVFENSTDTYVEKTEQAEQATPPAVNKEKPISSNYVLHIDNKWYVDVKNIR
ncbi:hypothetical protein [Pseudoalteromonas sp. NGC95]|uniref:hypothetical protein n=1 Tax=Pseudoalteromonas sp. NGC95 TaxID=2792051 RepID=UPI0018CFDDA0|nr:hypothetical protein [Pseudoalteromonas sp. NGC95]MBH0017859.1 hypothetical protein [Pseudoalteromonas sp. NGC95]